MTMIAPFSEHLSEQWLLDRTYHAQLRNGEELSVPDLTGAMKQLIDFDIPPSSQSSKSKVAERVPLIVYGNAREHLETASGTDYAVCYLDLQRGTFSNTSWRKWFSSDPTIFESSDHSNIAFLVSCREFPFTTHYKVIAADGQVYEYAGRGEAIQGFQILPPRKVSNGSAIQTVFPQFCYYHEVTCPSGVYRLEFFGPRMDEQGYEVKGAVSSGRERTQEVLV